MYVGNMYLQFNLNCHDTLFHTNCMGCEEVKNSKFHLMLLLHLLPHCTAWQCSRGAGETWPHLFLSSGTWSPVHLRKPSRPNAHRRSTHTYQDIIHWEHAKPQKMVWFSSIIKSCIFVAASIQDQTKNLGAIYILSACLQGTGDHCSRLRIMSRLTPDQIPLRKTVRLACETRQCIIAGDWQQLLINAWPRIENMKPKLQNGAGVMLCCGTSRLTA